MRQIHPSVGRLLLRLESPRKLDLQSINDQVQGQKYTRDTISDLCIGIFVEHVCSKHILSLQVP